MTEVVVRIPTPLRCLTAGASDVRVQGRTVREALVALEDAHSGATSRVLDQRGELHAFVNVFVGEKNVNALRGLETALADGAVLSIVPAVAGGAR